jgi:hypothetical protein
MATPKQELEAFLRLSERKYGLDAPVPRGLQRQLDAINTPPLTAKATFLMGGKTHSGNIPFRHRKSGAGPSGSTVC